MAEENAQIEEQQEKISSLEEKISDLSKQLEDAVDLLKKHTHSGKETADISKILSDRLGIKVSTIIGAAESVNIDIMGVLVSTGRAATGSTKVYDLFGNSFGVEWSGGGDPYFAFSADLIPVYANNAAAIAGGMSAGQVYRTNGDPETLCIVH